MTEPDYLPTRKQIEEACEEIQLGWSDYTRLKRRYGITQENREDLDWVPPLISYSEIRSIASQEDRFNHEI